MTEQELAELDLAVAKAEGLDVVNGIDPDGQLYRPTRDRDLAMRLLEKHKLELHPARNYWECQDGNVMRTGDTPCIAICKAVVALKGVPA